LEKAGTGFPDGRTGLGFYKYTATFDTNLDPAKREQLLQALQQLLEQKVPE